MTTMPGTKGKIHWANIVIALKLSGRRLCLVYQYCGSESNLYNLLKPVSVKKSIKLVKRGNISIISIVIGGSPSLGKS